MAAPSTPRPVDIHVLVALSRAKLTTLRRAAAGLVARRRPGPVALLVATVNVLASSLETLTSSAYPNASSLANNEA